MHSRRYMGTLLLTLTTFIWGSTFAITQPALHSVSPAELITLRFAVAGILFLPFLRWNLKLWRAAAELGAWLSIGFATQTIGLTSTSINRSAFITSMHVIFVPVLAGLWGRKTRLTIWIAAAIALGGVYLLSHDGSPPNGGDLWTLGCAIAWAIYIARMETLTRDLSSASLTAAHIWVVVILCGCWSASSGISTTHLPWKSILYLGIAATAFTTWMQTLGQKSVSAPQAAVLYTLEPVWASMFAWFLLRQKLGPQGKVGGAMILGAALLTQLPLPRIRHWFPKSSASMPPAADP